MSSIASPNFYIDIYNKKTCPHNLDQIYYGIVQISIIINIIEKSTSFTLVRTYLFLPNFKIMREKNSSVCYDSNPCLPNLLVKRLF